jgi:hypothetical protein
MKRVPLFLDFTNCRFPCSMVERIHWGG